MPTPERLPAVSVALATHQGAEHLEEQLVSILEQSVRPTEIVLGDDASTDGTVDLARRVAAAHPGAPELRVLENPEALGVAGNFARVLGACRGDVIALSDQDDVWEPERLEVLLARLGDRRGPVAVHSDARLVDGAGADLGETLFTAIGLSAAERRAVDEGRALDVLLRRNIATGATMIVTRALRDAALPIPAGWIHDEWLAVVAAIDGELLRCDAALTRYRQHGRNQIGAGSIGLSDRLDRLRQPRGPRNRRLLDRAAALAARTADAPPSIADRTAAKLRHEQRRSALPAVRLARLPGILAETLRGGYHRYGGGLQDVLRDAVQPAS